MLAGAIDRVGRGRAALFAAALIVVAALILLAGSGDEGEGGGGLPQLTPVAEAADRTAEYPGARMILTSSYDLPGGVGQMKMRGNGAYNGETGRFQIKLHSTKLPQQAAAGVPGGSVGIEEVGESVPGSYLMFMRSPSFGALPGDAEWMKLDLTEQAGSRAQSMDPRALLEELRSADDFEELGSERVRGVGTTHYSATVEQRDEVERLRADGDDEAADQLEKVLDAGLVGDQLEMEAWVDREMNVRRIAVAVPLSFGLGGGDDSPTMAMTIDLVDFGVTPEIELPAEDQVYDASELVEQQLDQLTD